jgi:hypothetical protein
VFALLLAAACPGQEVTLEFEYDSVPEWQPRAAEIRAGIAEKLGLDFDRPRPPVTNVIVHGMQVMDGYTVENVAFASLPGVYVTGNLYRPLGHVGRAPAILNPHGHFDEEGFWPRTRPDMQARCAQLARMGAIAFAWDMVGYGDSTQLDHESPLVPALQAWNSLRVVDWIASLPDVDPARIAVTGASGGASQAFVLTALDDRVALTAPVVMLSATYAGGESCEDYLPADLDLHGTLEVAALAAPRPQLVISDGEDWTATVPGIEFPWLWRLYFLYGATDLIENAHFTDEGHDYGASKRAAFYSFAERRLGLAPPPGPEPPPARHGSLIVFEWEHPWPPDALFGEEAIGRAMEDLR